ncbi:DEAD/DEAH box helicase family protein [Pseudorhodoferax sp.]|uniref:DEAD/DEAH box helicase family protein n=1 Tax=Pseudorhodoferax sp. TaxID=1993553 RepID=UPI0039E4EC85
MSQREVHAINGRLSLRAPQAESLSRLARAIETCPDILKRTRNADDVAAMPAQLRALFPQLQDFEREFPSLCFALATGVGKTRLMGAFITYLYTAHKIKHFFVLAPNLTIYDKLIADFTPNTHKYVFKGVAEFAAYPPEIITGDNYEERAQALGDLLSPVTINIFNIAKITSEVRGGKAPRIKRLSEYIGQSYFDYLAGLPDLVLLMDESHRYRAAAGMRAINDLQPLLGLELTATPFVETTKGPMPFRNVVMHYPLAQALDDGFVKDPYVVTQRNFDAKSVPPEELERIKLRDGVRMHELTKVELKTYARTQSVKEVKPFMLVIARDTTHAAALQGHMQSPEFFAGRYVGKVIQVDSSKTGAEEEAMVRKLLAVESVDEATEIVVHVNMLKEGWDVTNLYTIVPLRAANARTLVEQSIGRGLRLPYGKRVGVVAVDRLSIIAHDRFQEIVDDARRADSPLKLKTFELPPPGAQDDSRTQSVTVQPNLTASLGIGATIDGPSTEPVPSTAASGIAKAQTVPSPIFTTQQERQAALAVMEVLATYEVRPSQAPSRQALLSEELQAQITEAVREKLPPTQMPLTMGEDAAPELDLAAVVRRATEVVVQQTIDIPRIVVVPTGEVGGGFEPFTLDLHGVHPQPKDRSLVAQSLHTHDQQILGAQRDSTERRAEDYIVHALIDKDDIDYNTQASLLYDLAGQMVAHLRGYLSNEEEVRNVLTQERRALAENIYAQMQAHYCPTATNYTVDVRRGFTTLKAPTFTIGAGQTLRDYRQTVDEPSRIKQMVFGYFGKCLFPMQKFDSDTERRFAVILERDAEKWFKPAKGQFQIFYKLGVEQPEYVPDFVVETAHLLLMCETKARKDLATDEVNAKAEAGALWCQRASSAGATGKPWKYLLIPHEQVTEDKALDTFLQFARQ